MAYRANQLKELKSKPQLLRRSQTEKLTQRKLKLILPEDGNVNDLDVTIRASLDRIDSDKQYEVGNIQFISTPINYMKNTMSDKQTKEYLRVISANITAS